MSGSSWRGILRRIVFIASATVKRCTLQLNDNVIDVPSEEPAMRLFRLQAVVISRHRGWNNFRLDCFSPARPLVGCQRLFSEGEKARL